MQNLGLSSKSQFSLVQCYQSRNVPFTQDLKEQPGQGVNPDYGLATPTLVSPPKAKGGGPGRGGANGPKLSSSSNLEIALLKTYPFDSAVQRMTVVTKKKGAQHFDVYVKGAPEKVASLCKPETSEFEAVDVGTVK